MASRRPEGSGFKSRAAPATVTGEPCTTTPLAAAGKAVRGGDPASQETCPWSRRSAPGGVYRGTRRTARESFPATSDMFATGGKCHA